MTNERSIRPTGLGETVIRDWLNDHWIPVYFGIAFALFGIAVLLWKPGTRPIAGGLFVLSLTFVLAFVTVLVTDLLVGSEPETR